MYQTLVTKRVGIAQTDIVQVIQRNQIQDPPEVVPYAGVVCSLGLTIVGAGAHISVSIANGPAVCQVQRHALPPQSIAEGASE
jgi:hypothetical protein